jgi:hypothetical protein
MAVYVTGMLMPLSMFDVSEWQKLQKFLFIFIFIFTFWVLDNVLQVVASQYAVGNEDVIVH